MSHQRRQKPNRHQRNKHNTAISTAAPVVETKIDYEIVMSKPHTLEINGKTANISGKNVCIGAYKLQANQIDFRTICNLTDLFFTSPNLFSRTYDAPDVFQRTRNFLTANQAKIFGYKYFIAAINKTKTSGKKDLPNVNAAVTAWLLENLPHDTIFMDPIDFLKNPMLATSSQMLSLTNLSEVSRYIMKNVAGHIPIDTSECNKSESVTFINYQRGQGYPDHTERRQIMTAVNDPSVRFLYVKLTPGKYDYAGASAGAPKMCYREFGPSVAHLINQFTDFNEYLSFVGKSSIRKMYLVMDEFSGYAMFTIAAIKGFGLDRITYPLCYYRGSYSIATLF